MEVKTPKLQAAPLCGMVELESKPNYTVVMKNPNGDVVVVGFKKGQTLEKHVAPGDALVLCLEGSVTFNFDKDACTLNAGDFFTMEKGTAHSVVANADSKVMLNIFKA